MVAGKDLQLLGPLQAKVMMAVWGRDTCVAKDVHEELKSSYKDDIKYTTVVSTLNTLVKKGFLSKKKSMPAHEFEAQLSVKDYQHYMISEICRMFYNGDLPALRADVKKLLK